MAKEIERKFLLKEGSSIPIPEKFSKTRIKQGYLSIERDKHVRIRLSSHKKNIIAKLTIKFTDKFVREEFEYDIPLRDAKKMYDRCDFSLEKDRLSFDSNGVHYDVDTFPNGITFVEVEYKTIKSMEKWLENKPSWIGTEITGINTYSNITLSKQKLKF